MHLLNALVLQRLLLEASAFLLLLQGMVGCRIYQVFRERGLVYWVYLSDI